MRHVSVILSCCLAAGCGRVEFDSSASGSDTPHATPPVDSNPPAMSEDSSDLPSEPPELIEPAITVELAPESPESRIVTPPPPNSKEGWYTFTEYLVTNNTDKSLTVADIEVSEVNSSGEFADFTNIYVGWSDILHDDFGERLGLNMAVKSMSRQESITFGFNDLVTLPPGEPITFVVSATMAEPVAHSTPGEYLARSGHTPALEITSLRAEGGSIQAKIIPHVAPFHVLRMNAPLIKWHPLEPLADGRNVLAHLSVETAWYANIGLRQLVLEISASPELVFEYPLEAHPGYPTPYGCNWDVGVVSTADSICGGDWPVMPVKTADQQSMYVLLNYHQDRLVNAERPFEFTYALEVSGVTEDSWVETRLADTDMMQSDGVVTDALASFTPRSGAKDTTYWCLFPNGFTSDLLWSDLTEEGSDRFLLREHGFVDMNGPYLPSPADFTTSYLVAGSTGFQRATP